MSIKLWYSSTELHDLQEPGRREEIAGDELFTSNVHDQHDALSIPSP